MGAEVRGHLFEREVIPRQTGGDRGGDRQGQSVQTVGARGCVGVGQWVTSGPQSSDRQLPALVPLWCWVTLGLGGGGVPIQRSLHSLTESVIHVPLSGFWSSV